MKEKIISIIECDEYEETIDIELDGNKLFYGNGILTHNCGQNATDFELNEVGECIDVNSKLITKKGEVAIKDINVGDTILGSNGWTTVLIKHHPKIKKVYKIKTKSGKEIICSLEHQFPTNNGRKSIKEGLRIGDKLNTL